MLSRAEIAGTEHDPRSRHRYPGKSEVIALADAPAFATVRERAGFLRHRAEDESGAPRGEGPIRFGPAFHSRSGQIHP
jgi:hypothetical protein